jgi:anti-sigma factor RsiW
MNDEHLNSDTLIDYLHGELDAQDDARAMQHIVACAQCSALHDEQAALTDTLRAYARATERELPAGVTARIWDAIERENFAPSWLERAQAFLRPAYALPIAAALVVALYLGITTPQHGQALANIDATYYLEDHAALTGTVPFSEGSAVPALLENEETGSDQHWVASTGASDIASDR